MEGTKMKKSPGRKERRKIEHEQRIAHGKELQHMHIIEQRKAARAAYKAAKARKAEVKR
jgi:hypothetical protein